MSAGDVVTIEYRSDTDSYWMATGERMGVTPIDTEVANIIISQANDDGLVNLETDGDVQRFTIAEGNGYFEQFLPEQHAKTAEWIEVRDRQPIYGIDYGAGHIKRRFGGMRVPRSTYRFNRR